MDYRVLTSGRAERQLSQLDRQPIYRRLKRAIEALGADPRPRGAKRLAGHQEWRVRVADYRIIYAIDDAIRIVSIEKVGHRRDVYR